MNITPMPKKEEIRIENYISEEEKYILKFIEENRRVLLNASPGSGKTTFFAQLSISQIQNKKEGRIIFCSPFLIIQSQFKRAIEKKGLEIDLELNHTTSRNYLQETDRIITSTYQSLSRIKTDLRDNDLIIVDEAHSLLFTYGKGASRKFFTEIIKILHHTPAKIVLMTGTPYSGITKILNLSELKILKGDKKAQINIQYTNEKDTAIAAAFAENCLTEFGNNSLNIIYIKNTKKCEIIKKILERKFDCKAFVLTAARKDSTVYEQLKLESLIPMDINFLVTTNVISTGANILNTNVGKALMLNESNPTEIKQFSKRFRNKMDIEIDVVNKIYDKNELPTQAIRDMLKLERTHQRLFFNLSLAAIENSYTKNKEFLDFDTSYYNDVQTGSPFHLIDSILERMLIQEAYFADKIAETYNTPTELMEALNNYDDVISVNTENYNHSFSREDLGEKDIEILDQLKFEMIISDFLLNQGSYLKSAYWYFLLKKDIYHTYILSNYLNPDIPTSWITKQDVDEEKLKLFANSNFIHQILLPLISLDQFFKDRSKCIYFIKTVKPNKRKATILTLYINEIFIKYFNFNYDQYPHYIPKLEWRSSTNQLLLKEDERTYSLLRVCEVAYEYLCHQDYLNLQDLNEHLIQKCNWQWPTKKDDFIINEIVIDKVSKRAKDFKKNLLIAIANGIFFIQSKQLHRIDLITQQRKAAYLFETSLPILESSQTLSQRSDIQYIRDNTTIFNYEMVTRKFGKINLNNSIRILNNRELILNSVVDDKFYRLFSEGEENFE